MTLDELHRLLEPENLSLLEKHGSDEPADFAMRFQGHKDIPSRAIAEQIACRRKALKKLPTLSVTPLLFTSLALEQASSEATAAYKASLIDGERLIDLSGGLGIDAVFFSKMFREVVYCERDPVLAELARQNFRRLGISNVEIRKGESLEMLQAFPDGHFDWIFADPARREGGRRAVALSSSSPDVVAAHDLLLKKGTKVMVKTSPALELSGLRKDLPALSHIRVVSVGGECREELLLLERFLKEDRPVRRGAVLLDQDGAVMHDIAGTGLEERSPSVPVRQYFYEPDASIIRAGLTEQLSIDLGMGFVNESVDYLTAEWFSGNFPGRAFRVVAVDRYRSKSFKAFLQRHGITAAAIQRRDFPLSPDELRIRFRLCESDSRYLFFTRDMQGEAICVYCLKTDAEGAAVPSLPARNAIPEC